jgi:hypothetical protein
VYLGVVVVLATAMQCGITPMRSERLRECLGVSRRTLKRWRQWWQGSFVTGPFWRGAQGRFMPAVAVSGLPLSLLERFTGADEGIRLVQMMRFLCPLTTSSAEPPGR